MLDAVKVVENIRALDRGDVLTLTDEVVGDMIAALQRAHISSRSFAEWELTLANLHARITERIAGEIEGHVDLATVLIELEAAEWPDA